MFCHGKNQFNMADITDAQEGAVVLQELQTLWNLMAEMPEFSCDDIEARLGQIDALKNQVNELKEKAGDAKAKAEESEHKLDEVKQERINEQARHEKDMRQKEEELEKERMEKDAERRRKAKEIYEDKQRRGVLNDDLDWTLVPCPALDVPTTLPHLIKCGPGNDVTVLPGGNTFPKGDNHPLQGINGKCTYDYGATIRFKDDGQPVLKVVGGMYCD